MSTLIVLAMHGAPPNDFPARELGEYFGLHTQLEQMRGPQQARYAELDAKVRAWPRTTENDPFYAGSLALAQQLHQATGCAVIIGFNEFCAPNLDDALDLRKEYSTPSAPPADKSRTPASPSRLPALAQSA